MAPPVW